MNRKERFIETYEKNLFKGKTSKSGEGSELENTIILREKLIDLINRLNIETFIDAPCGDWKWMSQTIDKLHVTHYIGIDIVPELIEKNIFNYTDEKVNFLCKDLVEEIPSASDTNSLLFCRDCLVHLSFDSVNKILKNFVNSGIKYLLTTTFTNENRVNCNYPDGYNWYPINLNKNPFNFPAPLELINEGCIEGDNLFTDKSLGLWTREDIKKYVESL